MSSEIREKKEGNFYMVKYAMIIQVVTGAEGRADCDLVHAIGALQTKPYIGLCLTSKGSYSRVLNRRFTPVTHALLAAAAPGQLSAEELMKIRVQDGLVERKEYFLFGTPISQSLSPAMHNKAYQVETYTYFCTSWRDNANLVVEDARTRKLRFLFSSLLSCPLKFLFSPLRLGPFDSQRVWPG